MDSERERERERERHALTHSLACPLPRCALGVTVPALLMWQMRPDCAETSEREREREREREEESKSQESRVRSHFVAS